MAFNFNKNKSKGVLSAPKTAKPQGKPQGKEKPKGCGGGKC